MNENQMSAQNLRMAFGLSDSSLENLRRFGISMNMTDMVDAFHEWVEPRPEFLKYFANAANQEKVRAQQKDYWRDFFDAPLDEEYIAKRVRLGKVHASTELQIPTYLAAMNFFRAYISTHLAARNDDTPTAILILDAVMRRIELDQAVVMDAYARARGLEEGHTSAW